MTDTVALRAKAPSDLQMLAQVEQWMMLIREIGCETHAGLQPASERLELLLAPVTE